MYEDQDLDKAYALKDLGNYPDLDAFELAKIIYNKRTKVDEKSVLSQSKNE